MARRIGGGIRGELQVDDLGRRVAGVCGVLNAAHGQLVDLVVEVLATDGWHGHGYRSVEHWVALHTGLSPSRACQVVLVARRAGELPVTLEALRSGRLSIDRAVVVALCVPGYNDAEACELAVNLGVSQLRHALGRYQFDPPYPPPAPDPEPEPQPEPEPEPEPGPGPGRGLVPGRLIRRRRLMRVWWRGRWCSSSMSMAGSGCGSKPPWMMVW